MDVQSNLLLIFGVVVVGFLVADLGYFNRSAHKISPKSALIQSLFWIAIAFGFAFLIMLFMSPEKAAEFMSTYVTEKMLSVDNLFVIALIFSFFKIEEKYHHRVLFWGIMGAIVFRGLFIGIGAIIIEQFHWILYFFGALLIYTGAKLWSSKKEEHINFEDNKVVKLAKKYLPFTTSYHQGKFVLKEKGKNYFTLLFLIVLLVEFTDIIFAIDSIPAAFAITTDPFIIFTSNVFAIMGLRALFFLLENILHKFHHLQKGLSFILIFIGGKMLIDLFGIHISSTSSFVIIMLALGLSMLLSVLFPKKV